MEDGKLLEHVVWLANITFGRGHFTLPTYYVSKWPDYELIPILYGKPCFTIGNKMFKSTFLHLMGYYGIYVKYDDLEKLDKYKSLMMVYNYEKDFFLENKREYLKGWN